MKKLRTLAALAVLAVVTASILALGQTASANDSRSVVVDLQSLITSVGDPYPTAVDTTFVRSRGLLGLPGKLTGLVVKTYGENVKGQIQPANSCEEVGSGDGPSCAAVVALLNGATISSSHTSTAYLTNAKVVMINVAELGVPGKLVQAVQGNITGSLVGDFSIGEGADVMSGVANLQISGKATYICLEADLLPSPLLTTCELGIGKMLPYGLDIVDTGTFEISEATGVYADAGIASGGGTVTVNVNTPGIAGQPVGSMIIPALELSGS